MKEKEVTYYGMAKAMGVDRGSLYKSLKDNSNLELNTMMKVLDYLGYEIKLLKKSIRTLRGVLDDRGIKTVNR